MTTGGNRRGRWDWVALALLTGWLACVHASGAGLADPDEARSGLIARLMVERGDWLSPHLPAVFHHDYPSYPQEGDLIAYWDKPPLFFWLVAAAMKVFGQTALAVRLTSALSHIATVLLVWSIARHLWGRRAGLLAGAVMAVVPISLVMAHVARMEALLTALMTAMLVAAVRLLSDRPRSWTWTAVLYVAAGLGFLTKGPVAVVLPAAAVVHTLFVSGRLRDLRSLRPVAGLLLFLAVAAPWFIYAHLHYPPNSAGGGFTRVFFVSQNLARATTDEFGHRHPPGTLLAIFLGGLMPWTIFLPGMIRDFVRTGWRAWREESVIVLAMAWALAVLGAFSLSRTQLPHYVLPAVPPVALALGKYLAERTRPEDRDRLFGVGLWTTVATGLAAAAGLVVGLKVMGLWHSRYWWVVVVLVGLVVAGIGAIRRGRRAASVTLTVATMTALMTFLFSADPFTIYSTYTTRFESHELEKRLQPGDRVIAYPYTPYSLAWYLWPREVRYPTTLVDGQEIPTLSALIAELQSPGGRTFCVLQKKDVLRDLRKDLGRPIEVLSSRPRHTLIVVGPPKE